MNPLAGKFRKKGFDFALIKRIGDWALYERCTSPGKAVNFEVIHIQRHNGYTISGKEFPPAEYYPPSESWGTHGFTFMEEAKAIDFLNAKAKK